MFAHRKSIRLLLLIIPLLLLPTKASSQGEVTCIYEIGSDCNQWWDYARMYEDGSLIGAYMLDAGGWSDPYVLESVVVSGSGPCEHIPPITIYEPASCLATSTCPSKPRYYMYTFRDDDQPDTWQHYCYIISNNGYPGVESQARICSVPGFDHVYRATNMVYSGWVYTDCHGNASFGWPDWQSSWYRPSFAK
jgi:hypothetical protein